MKRNRLVAIGLLLAMTCTNRTSLAADTNLVRNGAFNRNLHGWSAAPGSGCSFLGGVCWTPVDADASPTSGSAFLGIASSIISPAATLTSSCVAVTGGDDYVVGLTVRFNGTGLPEAEASPLWFDDPECQSVAEAGTNQINSNAGIWDHIQHTVAAPAGAVAARLRLRALAPTSVYFDNVRLVHLAPGENTTTSTTMRECSGDCGNPLITTELPIRPIKPPDASDALYILLTAIGQHPPCQPCICDVDSDGEIGATDALLTLAFAVGEPVTLTCPAP